MPCSVHGIEHAKTRLLTDGFFINDKSNVYSNAMMFSMVIYLFKSYLN